MAMNDLLSDMIARIRNGQRAGKAVIACRASKLSERVLEVLKSEGYIRDYRRKEGEGLPEIEIELKYHESEPVIRRMRRVSRPGRRVYMAIGKLPRYHNGLGIAVLSTSKGVMSDHEARQANVGGEVLCTVF